jgi:hypothetical protein
MAESVPSSSADPGTVFSALSELVYAADTYDEIYAEICRAAVSLVAGCDHASLMLSRRGKITTVAASDEIALSIDRMERELHDGPCVDAILEEAGQIDADLTTRCQWPQLAKWVLANTPVRGMAGFRLLVDGSKVGALNLFSDTPGALEAGVDQAAVLASFTSVALMAASQSEQAAGLRIGIASNREIGKAVGLLMAFHKVNDEQAFEILRKTSQDLNMRLAEVAKEIVDHQNRR